MQAQDMGTHVRNESPHHTEPGPRCCSTSPSIKGLTAFRDRGHVTVFCPESHLQLSQEEVPSDTGGLPGLLFSLLPPNMVAVPGHQEGGSGGTKQGGTSLVSAQQLCSSDIPHSLSLSKTRFSLAYHSGFVLTDQQLFPCTLWFDSKFYRVGWGSFSHTGEDHQGFSAVGVDQAARDHCVHWGCWSCVLGVQKMPALSKCL